MSKMANIKKIKTSKFFRWCNNSTVNKATRFLCGSTQYTNVAHPQRVTHWQWCSPTTRRRETVKSFLLHWRQTLALSPSLAYSTRVQDMNGRLFQPSLTKTTSASKVSTWNVLSSFYNMGVIEARHQAIRCLQRAHTHPRTSTHRHTFTKIVIHEVMSQCLDVRTIVTQPEACITEDRSTLGQWHWH